MCGTAVLCSRSEQLVDYACIVLLVFAVFLCSLDLCTSYLLCLTTSPTAEPSGVTTPSNACGSVAHPVKETAPPLPGKYMYMRVCVCVCGVGGGGGGGGVVLLKYIVFSECSISLNVR